MQMKDKSSNYVAQRQLPTQLLAGPSDSRVFNRHSGHIKTLAHMLLKELPVSENEAQASTRESRASQGATNGCDEVAHPVQVHTALSKWVHAAPNSSNAEEIKYACLVPERVSYFQTPFYECTRQPCLKKKKKKKLELEMNTFMLCAFVPR